MEMTLLGAILRRLDEVEKKLGMGEFKPRWADKIAAEAHRQVGTSKYRSGITKDGRLACAAFVSGVLLDVGAMTGKIEYGQARLERRLRKQGWVRVDKPAAGDLIFWDAYPGRTHGHVGIFVEGGNVIDNSSSKRVPVLRTGVPHKGRPVRCYLRRV